MKHTKTLDHHLETSLLSERLDPIPESYHQNHNRKSSESHQKLTKNKRRYHPSSSMSLENNPKTTDDNNHANDDDNRNSNNFLTTGIIELPAISCLTNQEKPTRIDLFSLFSKFSAIIFAWLVLWLLFPQKAYEANTLMNPGGVVFDALVLFILSSICSKWIGNITGVPPLIFIFFIALFWGNIPEFNFLTGGISKDTRRVTTRIGLANIMLRTGLAISPKKIAPAKWNIMAMSLLPLITEILVHGFVAGSIMPNYKNASSSTSGLWPFLQAAVVAPSASGVVAAVVMIVQKKGYMKERGPGVLLISACGLDMSIGVWFVNFMASLIFREEGSSLAWDASQGPLQLIVGSLLGTFCGMLWYVWVLRVVQRDVVATTTVVENNNKNDNTNNNDNTESTPSLSKEQFENLSFYASITLGLFAFFNIVFGYFIESAGGGCVSCTFVGVSASYFLSQEEDPTDNEQDETDEKKTKKNNCLVKLFSADHHPISRSDQLKLKLAIISNFALLWDNLVVIALFSFSASSLNLVKMFDPTTVGTAIATIFIGFICRAFVTLGCSYSFPGSMSTSEWIIISIALGGKAFTQVALGEIGKQAVRDKLENFNSTELIQNAAAIQEWNTLSDDVAHAGALSVMFVSPIVVVLLSVIGPKLFWLTDEEWKMKEKEEEDNNNDNNAECGEESNTEQGEEMASTTFSPALLNVPSSQASPS